MSSVRPQIDSSVSGVIHFRLVYYAAVIVTSPLPMESLDRTPLSNNISSLDLHIPHVATSNSLVAGTPDEKDERIAELTADNESGDPQARLLDR